MSSRREIEEEINRLSRPDRYDVVRREKLKRVTEITGRALVIYAVDFTSENQIKAQAAGNLMSISVSDKDSFDEITRSIEDDKLDILLHSPGGSAEATESIVEVLRARFSNIRFIIPNMAKSAATMMAMSGDQLLMDEVSELGPTDPQMIIVRDGQPFASPAQAIKDQFAAALDDIKGDPARAVAWLPILREYGPSLLAECDNYLALAEELVERWLQTYMFAEDRQAARKARKIARYLSSHNQFRSHGRRVGIKDLQKLGINILDMRIEPKLHTAVRELYAALMITFDNTGACRIFENSNDEALITMLVINQAGPIPQSQALQQKPASKLSPSKGFNEDKGLRQSRPPTVGGLRLSD